MVTRLRQFGNVHDVLRFIILAELRTFYLRVREVLCLPLTLGIV